MTNLYPSLNWQDVEQYSNEEIKNSFGGFLLDTLPGPGPSDAVNEVRFDELDKEGWAEFRRLMAEMKAEEENPYKKLTIGPLEGMRPSKDKSLTYRYPSDAIDSETDYVFFQFGKYKAPFGREVKELAKIKDGDYNKNDAAEASKKMFVQEQRSSMDAYNDSVNVLEPKDASIMLPIPQDVGHEVAQQWQGKQWSATGRAATAALGAGQLSDAKAMLGDVAGWGTAVQNSLTQMALNVLPGVGGNISFNDLSGATRGIVINPNAELMYDSPEMREIGMVFKMVPRTPDESKIIRRICQAFRKHSMPMYGGAESQTEMDKLNDGW